MSYSTVHLRPVRTKVRSEQRTIDGNSVIQELGYLEEQSYIFDWITTDELQAEIDRLEETAADGWMTERPARTQIHPALDLFRVQVNMHRFIATT